MTSAPAALALSAEQALKLVDDIREMDWMDTDPKDEFGGGLEHRYILDESEAAALLQAAIAAPAPADPVQFGPEKRPENMTIHNTVAEWMDHGYSLNHRKTLEAHIASLQAEPAPAVVGEDCKSCAGAETARLGCYCAQRPSRDDAGQAVAPQVAYEDSWRMAADLSKAEIKAAHEALDRAGVPRDDHSAEADLSLTERIDLLQSYREEEVEDAEDASPPAPAAEVDLALLAKIDDRIAWEKTGYDHDLFVEIRAALRGAK